MRAIDADALFRAINRIRCPQGASMGDGLAEACQAILDAPTIDAVPVVRCKDCKMQWGCKSAQYLGNNGFCSYGERKGGDGNA